MSSDNLQLLMVELLIETQREVLLGFFTKYIIASLISLTNKIIFLNAMVNKISQFPAISILEGKCIQEDALK